MTTNIANLNWGQRLAIINGTQASDEDASAVFQVSVDEIKTARENVTPSDNFDITPFAAQFSKPTTSASSATDEPTTSGKVVKKRGRRGSKVQNAFAAVTNAPQPLDSFAATNGVSVNVLRQTKRFADGMNIKVGKIDGVTSIWVQNVDDTEVTDSDATKS